MSGRRRSTLDDTAIEAAMQRVLTDAARRYGIEV